METELLLADLDVIEKRLATVGKKMRATNNKDVVDQYNVLEKCQAILGYVCLYPCQCVCGVCLTYNSGVGVANGCPQRRRGLRRNA